MRQFVVGLFLPLALAGAGLLLLSTWGNGQHFQPNTLEGKLKRGMSVAQAERALGLSPNSLARPLRRSSDRKFVVEIARSGFGSLFVPQYTVGLVFTPEKTLDKCLIELNWRMEEVYIPTRI